jgi:murein DD-endopeptidase MepM/ murein hydrolase activator NlpD
MNQRNIGKFLGILILALVLSFPAAAMDWPTEDGVMVNNFGANNKGRPLLGAVFETDGPVRAAEEGDILFSNFSENSASRLPSPLGSWVAMDHGDGLISIYGHLEDTQEITILDQVSRGRVIAAAGQTGWTGLRGFSFSFFDRKERRWINPSMIITPREDTRQPLIAAVELQNNDGQIINPSQARISQGRYTIRVNAQDTMLAEGENPLAPYSIHCSVNGVEIGALNFET